MVSKIEQEINEIRLQIYEKIKEMTSEEQGEYYRKSGEAIAKEYGFKIYNSMEEYERDKEARRDDDACEG